MFPGFARAVASAFQGLGSKVFVADIDGDALYEKYLGAFPEGTNPIFRVRTEHDCSCCKQFIRRAGMAVAIDDKLKVHTVWDTAAEGSGFYAEVATALRDEVRAAGIRDIFRVAPNEGSFGAPQTRSLDAATQKACTWNHLHTGPIFAGLQTRLPDTARGDYRTAAQVLERGLLELSPEAVETVHSLITSNALYRGTEHLAAVTAFQKLQRSFAKAKSKQSLFTWKNAELPAARFRNTVIGTLVQDLSEGQDIERAVKSFETKVAPHNYKRTTALITPGMVKKAMETIESLGLESALERRFAVIGDVSVNDVKWVDGTVKPLMKGGIGDVLMQHAVSKKKVKEDEERAQDISLDAFMTTVLPEAQGVEIFLKGGLLNNLMSLTAPVHPEPKQLFRWTNDFAWSYGGNVADSIKERVKRAGGRVDNVALRVSLSWFNFDDLDIHIYEPGMGHIYYGHKHGITGGNLDVDMNAGGGSTREPVENVVWSKPPPSGSYKVVVNNFNRRETGDPGFVVEIENDGKLSHYSYSKGVGSRQNIEVATLELKFGVISSIAVGKDIATTNISKEKWGLKTEQYVKVNAVTLSPNYWGENQVGNLHTFFVLEGAKSDEDTRGFYNEFLHPRLEPHRKVFEVIADKAKCRPTEGQLSGLGFSSTKPEQFLVRVQQGNKRRLFNISVGAVK